MSDRPKPKFKYDKTSARRQKKRRDMYMRMKAALQKVDQAETLEEAKAIARDGLDENVPEETER